MIDLNSRVLGAMSRTGMTMAAFKEILRTLDLSAEEEELIEEVMLCCQADDISLQRVDGNLWMFFPILGSDPEHYWEEYDIQSIFPNNAVNLTAVLARRA